MAGRSELVGAMVAQVKNTGTDMLDGRVGRIYMPKQDIGNIALHKMKVRPRFVPHCNPLESCR
jgi:hypothetical protein